MAADTAASQAGAVDRPLPGWDTLAAWVERRVHVVGVAGTEGAAIARFLAAEGARQLTLHDLAAPEDLEAQFKRQHVGLPAAERDAAWHALRSLPCAWRLGVDYLSGVEDAEVVFAPQAWYLYAPNIGPLGALRARGVPFSGLMDLYFGLSKARIVAVTGSNGKSTTSRLIEHLLRGAGVRTYYAGNERRSVQVLDALRAMSAEERLVLEVSNRHLLDLSPRPWIAVVTNVLPNHLDEHGGDFEAYARVKRKLVAGVGPDGWAVLNADNGPTRAMASASGGPVLWFSRSGRVDRGVWSEADTIMASLEPGAGAVRVAATADVMLPGRHNLENALAAVAAALLAGAPPASIAPALRTFRGLRHRTQFVWSGGGARFYDDLNSTTPQATIAALEALTDGARARAVVLLIGGDDKALDTSDLVAAILRHVRRLVVLPGPGGERIARDVAARAESDAAAAPAITFIERLPDAVATVVADAEPGDVVLLSPACPYFFRRHYLDGGEEVGFRQLLRTAFAASATGRTEPPRA